MCGLSSAPGESAQRRWTELTRPCRRRNGRIPVGATPPCPGGGPDVSMTSQLTVRRLGAPEITTRGGDEPLGPGVSGVRLPGNQAAPLQGGDQCRRPLHLSGAEGA